MKRMPSLFVGHGSPMNVVENNSFTRALTALAAALPRPRAILVVSAHWISSGIRLTSSPEPPQMYDFFGFPEELYKTPYAAPGSPETASETAGLLDGAGFPCAQDPLRGIDHAAWAVLKHMYPAADIPVLEMSLDYKLEARLWFDLGAALKPLRDKGVLVMGSGNIVHNLYRCARESDAKPFPWALEFNEKVKEAIARSDREKLASYAVIDAKPPLAVPTPEHYLPLLAALGTMGEGETAKVFHESFQNASIAMTGFEIS